MKRLATLALCFIATSCQSDAVVGEFSQLARPTTSTSTSTTSSTSTTLPPTTTVVAPTTTTPPTTTPAPPAEPCAAALVGLHAVGLPPEFAFYCDAAYTRGNNGITVWNTGSRTGFVAIDPVGGNYAGIGAHEACHAQGLAVGDDATEADAFACAAAHGYPEPYE
jgi:hypothetical protein